MTCPRCDENRLSRCLCGELDDQPDDDSNPVINGPRVIYVTRAQFGGFARDCDNLRKEAIEWRGMEGHREAKE